MEQIKNFLPVSDLLACAGQPDEAQLAAIAADGYQVVINLGLSDGKYALPDEASTVARLGLDYFHIPVLFDNPQLVEWKSFLAIMREHESRRTLVHCAANYRATAFTGLYLFATAKLTAGELPGFIAQIWQPDPVWQRFIDEAVSYISETRRP